MKRPSIPIIECPRCRGKGGAPDVGTGPVLRQERRDADVLLKDMLPYFGFSKTYTGDLEADKRPWSWELIDHYRKAIAMVVSKRLEEAA